MVGGEGKEKGSPTLSLCAAASFVLLLLSSTSLGEGDAKRRSLGSFPPLLLLERRFSSVGCGGGGGGGALINADNSWDGAIKKRGDRGEEAKKGL